MPPNIPKPTIYLRNKFSIKPGLNGLFFAGQKALLENLPNDIELIAACGQQELLKDHPAPQQLPGMMHLWKLPEWDTLYRLMFSFSESDWYTSEVSSLEIEHQDLLVGIGHGIEPNARPGDWMKDHAPYVYLYDEIRLNPQVTTLTYLRHLNWFTTQLKDRRLELHLQWIATEITGTPSQVCLLWRMPSINALEKVLSIMAYEAPYATRYAEMMSGIKSLSRQYMFPESTEALDNDLKPKRSELRNRHDQRANSTEKP